MTAKEGLISARYLLATKGWTQNVSARDRNGQPCLAASPEATCYCALGACTAAFTKQTPQLEEAIERLQLTLKHLKLALGQFDLGSIALYNDTEGRTLAEVLALFDKTIEALA